MTLAAFGLSACGSQGKAPSVAEYQKAREAAMAHAKTAPAAGAARPGAAAATPEGGLVAVSRDYHYDPTGKRDPFRSFVLERAKEQHSAERGPLEQFDLSQLNLVAVVWNTPKPRALVTDPSGRGYIVSEGTPIGKNEGRITKIQDNGIVVKETYVDYLGERTEKDIELRVRQSQGG